MPRRRGCAAGPKTGRPGHDRPVERAAALVRPEVRDLSLYSLHQVEARYKLDQNEAPWDLPRSLKRKALARLADRPWSSIRTFTPTGCAG